MQTFSVDQLVGRTLGEYQIERLLGHGRLGAAYLARQRAPRRTVMMTLFNFPEGMSAQERDQCATRLAQERATLLRLTHPTLLPVYDLGEHAGSLCLVTAFVKRASLAQALQHQGRFTPHQALEVVKQVAAGLDYAHSQGAAHGLLSLADVLISDEFTVQLAGFGLRTILEVYGKRPHTQPQAYLFSTSGTFLGHPASVSPERVLGMPVDSGSDIYALGVMLFELLSGTPPFRGATPLDIVLERLQQPVPSVHTVCPDVPEALDLVLSKTLERDPAKRYQRAGESAAAFERVLTTLEAMHKATDSRTQQLAQGPQLTLAPTVNWFEEAGMPAEQWQSVPPLVTGHPPVVTSSPSLRTTTRVVAGSAEMYPSATVQLDSPTAMVPAKEAFPPPAGSNLASLAGVDPFARWSATSPRPGMLPPAPGTFTQRSNPRSRRRTAQQDRRKLVKLLAVGTAGVLTVSGISFAHFIQSMKQAPSQIASVPTAGSTAPATTQGNTPTVGTTQGAQKTPTASKSPTAQPSPSATKGAQPSPTSQPTQQPTPQPTQPPAPTPTPPGHTGTVIGSTNQATNSAKNFTNPANGNASLLIHLGNGNFVACEKACTHAGVPVNYDSGSGKLVCPAHGATFNADGTNPTSPAPSPLPQVTIRVNGDGTITTG